MLLYPKADSDMTGFGVGTWRVTQREIVIAPPPSKPIREMSLPEMCRVHQGFTSSLDLRTMIPRSEVKDWGTVLRRRTFAVRPSPLRRERPTWTRTSVEERRFDLRSMGRSSVERSVLQFPRPLKD